MKITIAVVYPLEENRILIYGTKGRFTYYCNRVTLFHKRSLCCKKSIRPRPIQVCETALANFACAEAIKRYMNNNAS